MEQAGFDVGGIRLERPFKVQRLGHLALAIDDPDACLHFYGDLLGMNISDAVDFAAMFGKQTPGRDGNAYFLNIASDHHSTVLFPRWAMPPRDEGPGTDFVTHMAWQVGTMKEVLDGGRWLTSRYKPVRPGSRDPAGANYNGTVYDVNSLPNEIYYGMDQIGWSGCSKPPELWSEDDLPLPPPGGAVGADFEDVRRAVEAGGVDLRRGLHRRPWPPERFQVDGVMLPRPFRVVRNMPIGLFVGDVDTTAAFYREAMGFVLTETVEFEGARCHYLRVNSDHHVLAIMPRELAGPLGLHTDSLCAYYGLQLQNYSQLRAAIAFLRDNGVDVRPAPAGLVPGIDYAAFAIAPDGHAVLLYYYMEQIGWDGRPRPPEARTMPPLHEWPETAAARSDTYQGPVFMGPIG